MKVPSASLAVVIPTKDRREDLDLTITSLLGQTVLPQQLIVIDQSPTDESERSVRSLISGSAFASSDGQFMYRRDTSLSGLTAARNCSLQYVKTDLVLFLDDDVLLEPDFIERILQVFDERPAATGVSGIITNYTRPPAPFLWWTRLFLLGPFHDDRQPVYWTADKLAGSAPVRVTRLGGGLMCFRMSLIRGIFFDERLRGAAPGEDVEFCARMKPGAILLIAPDARLVHKQTPVARSSEHWLERHTQTMWYLYLRNWDHGLFNRLCFGWLNLGYMLVALAVSVRRRSPALWGRLALAIRIARDITRVGSPSEPLPAIAHQKQTGSS
jgi:glucosyl-dolichyl phosphate glucuronosyltransferase